MSLAHVWVFYCPKYIYSFPHTFVQFDFFKLIQHTLFFRTHLNVILIKTNKQFLKTGCDLRLT